MSKALQHPDDSYAIALEDINVAGPALFMNDEHWGFFDRLRKEAPVHYCRNNPCGPFWSVTRFNDIMEVEKNTDVFSSEGSITLMDRPEDFNTESFISMTRYPAYGSYRRCRTDQPGKFGTNYLSSCVQDS